jgi:hypothetical protein
MLKGQPFFSLAVGTMPGISAVKRAIVNPNRVRIRNVKSRSFRPTRRDAGDI